MLNGCVDVDSIKQFGLRNGNLHQPKMILTLVHGDIVNDSSCLLEPNCKDFSLCYPKRWRAKLCQGRTLFCSSKKKIVISFTFAISLTTVPKSFLPF